MTNSQDAYDFAARVEREASKKHKKPKWKDPVFAAFMGASMFALPYYTPFASWGLILLGCLVYWLPREKKAVRNAVRQPVQEDPKFNWWSLLAYMAFFAIAGFFADTSWPWRLGFAVAVFAATWTFIEWENRKNRK